MELGEHELNGFAERAPLYERVDHFGRGLQVVAATADRCNTSATSHVRSAPQAMEDGYYTAGISISPLRFLCDSFSFPPYLTVLRSSSFFFFPLCVFFSHTVHCDYALTK